MFRSKHWIGVFLLILSIISSVAFVSPKTLQAQETTKLTPEQEAALRAELADIEKQIQAQQAILTTKQQEASSIQRDVSILDAKIKQAKLKIQAHDLAIKKLGKDITVKTNTITALSSRIDRSKLSIEQTVQKTNELDSYSLAEAVLSNKNISTFFSDFDAYASVQKSLQERLNEIKDAKKEDEIAREELDDKRNQEIDTKVNVETEKKKIEVAESEKKRLLNLNKAQQKDYQTVIADKQKRATQIRNQLFALRDTAAIKFGDAVSYAKAAAGKTGVRAAFVLAILQQESNLGQNVGSCYLTSEDGSGVKSKTGASVSNVMKATRDVQPFLQITKALGRDPFKTLVSCPFSVGYGGAMGPAQFIPSTWMLFQDRVAASTGKGTADPWNAQDAFMASATYLSDLGASGGSYTAERNAACKYYSGRSCSGSNKFYGDQVMARVQSLQDNIDIISGN
ncbi:MAG: hypothetical protein RL094_287 [Candidatus Parcubacteria bacterium]|jgi:membrane-bound lytic murein transglycosylase B